LKNLFVFSPIPLFPLKQGNRIRLYQTLKKFVESGFEITYFCNNLEDSGKIDAFQIAQHNKFCKKFIYTKYQGNHFNSYQRGEQSELDVWDYSINQKLKEAIGEETFDVCLTNYSLFTQVFSFFPAATYKIVEMHDRLGDRAKLVNKHGVISDFFSTTVDREIKYLDRADTVICIKNGEADYLKKNGFTKNAITGYSPLEDKTPFVLSSEYLFNNKTIGFIGSDNRVNRQCISAIFRYAELQSSYLQQHKIKFLITGRVSPFAQSVIPSDLVSLIEIMGEVEELSDFYKSISLLVNPTKFSTGFKLKNVESYSYGVPLVSTDDASDGIPNRPKFLTNQTPHKALETAVNYLLDRDIYENLYNSSLMIKNRYKKLEKESWEKIVNTVFSRRIFLNIDAGINESFNIIVCQMMHDYLKVTDQIFITSQFFNSTIYEYLLINNFKVERTSIEGLTNIDFTLSVVTAENQKSRLLVGKSAITIRPELKGRIYLSISLTTLKANGSTVSKNGIKPYFVNQFNEYTSKKMIVYFKTHNLKLDQKLILGLKKLSDDLIVLNKHLTIEQIIKVQDNLNNKFILVDFSGDQQANEIKNYFYNFYQPFLITNRFENVNLYKKIQGPETEFINVDNEIDSIEIVKDILNSHTAYSKMMLWSPYRDFAGY
jgi:glycosyltransferase involved in cell wall biosynthesis